MEKGDYNMKTAGIQKIKGILCNIEIYIIVMSMLYFVLMLLYLEGLHFEYSDGNYIYKSSMIINNKVMYKDFYYGNTPILPIVGAILLKIYYSIVSIRIYTIMLHIATMFLVYLISLKLFSNKQVSFLAAIIFFILPINFTYSTGFYAQALAGFLSLIAFYFFISLTRRKMILSAIFMSLAIFTKLVVMPVVLVTLLYLVIRRRNLLKYYFIPLILTCSFFLFLTTMYSSNTFFDNAIIMNSRMPHNSIFQVVGVALHILHIEGIFILSSLAGLLIYLNNKKNDTGEYISLWLLASFASLLFTFKWGTGMPIFRIAEPGIAIFSAYLLYKIYTTSITPALSFFIQKVRSDNREILRNPKLILNFIIVFLLITLMVSGPIINGWGPFLYKSYSGGFDNITNADKKLVQYIEEYTNETDMVLLDPYYAFLSQRDNVVCYDDAFGFIRFNYGDPNTIKQVDELYELLEKKSIKIIVVQESRLDWLIKPIFSEPILSNYKQIYKSTNNYVVYIPKEEW